MLGCLVVLVVKGSLSPPAGPYGERDDQQVFIQRVVPDTDKLYVRLSSNGKRSVQSTFFFFFPCVLWIFFLCVRGFWVNLLAIKAQALPLHYMINESRTFVRTNVAVSLNRGVI